MPACYTDRISARPGDPVRVMASARGPCRLELARIGAGRQPVLTLEGLAAAERPVPATAACEGCGWPEIAAFTVDDWPSGYYDLTLTDATGATAHHFLCVRPPHRRAAALIVLSTNTWVAYNWFGGANAYCDVAALMERRQPLAEAMAGAVGRLSLQRPFAPLLLAPPPGMPRLVTLRPRGFEEKPTGSADPDWSRAHRQSPYDASAGFLQKWEAAFVGWAERQGLALDYATDLDLDREADALDGYATVLLVGHSEYWSGPQRAALDAHVDGGGHLVILSGNTGFWKVRWEGDVMVCHKWRGFEAEAVPAAAATHLWSHPAFGRPEAALTGLSFVYGGYHRLGLCAARGAGGFTVWRDDHWALEGTDLFYGDVVGADIPLVGYENDGCPLTVGEDGLPRAVPRLGVPEGLEVIASVPAVFAEPDEPRWRRLIPPEQLDVVARIAWGEDSPAAQRRVCRGHAVMATHRRGRGAVFNAGTTEWAHGLGDPFVERITLNVLRRFGAFG